jgi:hypothetical protein
MSLLFSRGGLCSRAITPVRSPFSLVRFLPWLILAIVLLGVGLFFLINIFPVIPVILIILLLLIIIGLLILL